jgi:hypothetical protein
VTMLGVVGAVAQRQAQAVVCLHQCLTFGEQGLLPVRTCANGGGATSHTRPFGSARLKRASIDAATRAGAAAG